MMRLPPGVPTIAIPRSDSRKLGDMLDRYGSFDRNLEINAPGDVEYGYNAGTKLTLDGIQHLARENPRLDYIKSAEIVD